VKPRAYDAFLRNNKINTYSSLSSPRLWVLPQVESSKEQSPGNSILTSRTLTSSEYTETDKLEVGSVIEPTGWHAPAVAPSQLKSWPPARDTVTDLLDISLSSFNTAVPSYVSPYGGGTSTLPTSSPGAGSTDILYSDNVVLGRNNTNDSNESLRAGIADHNRPTSVVNSMPVTFLSSANNATPGSLFSESWTTPMDRLNSPPDLPSVAPDQFGGIGTTTLFDPAAARAQPNPNEQPLPPSPQPNPSRSNLGGLKVVRIPPPPGHGSSTANVRGSEK